MRSLRDDDAIPSPSVGRNDIIRVQSIGLGVYSYDFTQSGLDAITCDTIVRLVSAVISSSGRAMVRSEALQRTCNMLIVPHDPVVREDMEALSSVLLHMHDHVYD